MPGEISQAATESVLYSVPKKTISLVLPKTLLLIFLSALFYGGIILNISLLSLRRATESNAKIGSLFVIIFLIIFGIISNFVKAKHPITFLQSGLKLSKHKTLSYAQITNIERKTSISDKIFSTYHLKINKKYTLEGIDNSVDLESYLNQLVSYAKGQQMQQQSYLGNQGSYSNY